MLTQQEKTLHDERRSLVMKKFSSGLDIFEQGRLNTIRRQLDVIEMDKANRCLICNHPLTRQGKCPVHGCMDGRC